MHVEQHVEPVGLDEHAADSADLQLKFGHLIAAFEVLLNLTTASGNVYNSLPTG